MDLLTIENRAKATTRPFATFHNDGSNCWYEDQYGSSSDAVALSSTTDVTNMIRAVFDDAPAGSTILFKTGEYVVVADDGQDIMLYTGPTFYYYLSFHIQKNLHIIGEGEGNTILKLAPSQHSATHPTTMFYCHGYTDLEIAYMTLDGDVDNQTSLGTFDGAGLILSGRVRSGGKFHDLTLQNSPGYGMYLGKHGTTWPNFERRSKIYNITTINNAGCGIALDNVVECNISNIMCIGDGWSADALPLALRYVGYQHMGGYEYLGSLVTFYGSGLDDMTYTSTGYYGIYEMYWIKITTAAGTDKFKWKNARDNTWSDEISITGAAQPIENGFTVTFGATTGHTLGDYWYFCPRRDDRVVVSNLSVYDAYVVIRGVRGVEITGLHIDARKQNTYTLWLRDSDSVKINGLTGIGRSVGSSYPVVYAEGASNTTLFIEKLDGFRGINTTYGYWDAEVPARNVSTVDVIGGTIAYTGMALYALQGSTIRARGIRLLPSGTPTYIVDCVTPSTIEVWDCLASGTKGALYATGTLTHFGTQGMGLEERGAAATISDGGTIAHGLLAAPTKVQVTGTVANEMVSVTGMDATNITVAIKKPDGSAGTSQTIHWWAKV